ncbi:KxYKxGKxW signal peptide domain-containing protein [Levilactobacillus parabrevis]|uniref:KxYKxGKxW signal peptide domain-containing protein n=1 Tax=Levilactobacillus parabrevis TaxID=357278 RepID=UPI00375748E6
MRKQIMTDTKEHYKSYKAGKHWVFACMTAATLGLGLTGMSVNASADTDADNPAAPTTTATATSTTTAGNTQTLPKTTSVNTDSKAGSEPGTGDDSGNAGNSDINTNEGNGSNDGSIINKDNNGKDTNDIKNSELNTDDPANKDVNNNKESEKTDDTVVNKNDNTGLGTNDNDVVNKNNDSNDNIVPGTNTLKAPGTSRMSRAALLKEAPTYDDKDIQGVDATIWLPDAALRSWVEYNTQKNLNGVTITDANLYQYVDKLLLAGVSGYTGPNPTTLEGLQYFKNITAFDYTGDIAPADWISFSFAPNLSQFMVSSKDSAAPSMDATTFINSVLGENDKLQYLMLTNLNLTGNLPDMSSFQNLTNLNLGSNHLTGSLDDIGDLQPNTSLNLASNQLSGPLTLANFKNLRALYISNNDLTGDFPVLDAAANSIILDAQNNHLTSGLQDPTSNQVTMNQTLKGGSYTITPKNRTFDPITHYVSGVLGENGTTIDMTDPMTVYGWSNGAGSLFTVTKDDTNPIGFNLTASKDVPDGTYTVWALNSKTSQYAFSLTFSIVNGTDPVVTPPTTGGNGGTVTPPATGGNDDNSNTVTPPTDNGTNTDETPVTGGDGATIDSTAPAKATKNAKIQQTPPATKQPTTTGGAAATVNTTRHAATKPVAVASAKAKHNTVTLTKTAPNRQNKATTTLPQTNEKRGVSAIAVGVALAISLLGLGVGLRRHE